MMFAKLTIFLCAIICSKCQDDLDSALAEVFENNETRGPSQKPEENEIGCECVPFYLCNANNTLNEYGEGIIDIKFGGGDCPHYMDKCCSVQDTIPPTTMKPNPTEHTCGNYHPEGVGFRITGATDNEANYGEFPWMVAVLRRDHITKGVDLKIMECGGSIIHPRVVLTGAHCVKGKHDLFIRAGEWDTQTDKELYPTQERNVSRVIIHEKYYAGGLHNDIALLVLESDLELSEVVGTICLPNQGENMDKRNCLVSGWGKDVFGKEGKYQVILKKVEQPTIERGVCQAALRKTRLGPRFRLHESLLCAGGQKGKDACKGDGGSPLVCPDKNNPSVYVQAGIVAWGIGCGNEVPAVYVNVPHLKSWVDAQLASLNFS